MAKEKHRRENVDTQRSNNDYEFAASIKHETFVSCVLKHTRFKSDRDDLSKSVEALAVWCTLRTLTLEIILETTVSSSGTRVTRLKMPCLWRAGGKHVGGSIRS